MGLGVIHHELADHRPICDQGHKRHGGDSLAVDGRKIRRERWIGAYIRHEKRDGEDIIRIGLK